MTFLYETVIDDGEHWVIRHVELHGDGRVSRYWWGRLEDADGFLAEGALQPAEWGLERLAEIEFAAAWARDPAPGNDS